MKLLTVSLSVLIVTASLSQPLCATVEAEVVHEDPTNRTSSTQDVENVKNESEDVSSDPSLHATQDTRRPLQRMRRLN